MTTLLEWLRRNLWAAFLAHQLFVLASVVIFLTSVRQLTGRNIHLGQDPVGFPIGMALAVLSIAFIFMTNWYYRLLKVRGGNELGIAFSRRRFLDLVVGFILGALFFSAPLLIALWQGNANISDRIDAHFDLATIVAVLSGAALLLLLQAATEETTNRAFPMRIWEHRSLLFRLLIPSAFFVVIHLVSETFGIERVIVLLMAGIVHGLAFALTGNIWLTTGLHWGANVAGFSMSGFWHAGAVVNVVGQPALPVWAMGSIMLALLSLGLLVKHQFAKGHASHPSANA
jgi:membrane protease YdiL (CAAX protease family)